MILEPQRIKSDTVSTVSPSISHEVMEIDATGIMSSKVQCTKWGTEKKLINSVLEGLKEGRDRPYGGRKA